MYIDDKYKEQRRNTKQIRQYYDFIYLFANISHGLMVLINIFIGVFFRIHAVVCSTLYLS